MAVALVPREDNASANDNPPPARNAVLARYRQLREINKKHHHDILKLISGDAMLQQARRLGLVQGRTLILDDMEEMSYVFDLAIYTAPPQRSRAIDRYARSAQLPPGSDEARMLEAMRAARFAILIIGPRHEAAGVIATDLLRRTRVWLVDIGLEASLEEGAMMATRLYTPEQFSMTAGVNVPFDLALIEDIYDALADPWNPVVVLPVEEGGEAAALSGSWFSVGAVGIVDEYHPLVSTEAGSHLVFDLLVDHAGSGCRFYPNPKPRAAFGSDREFHRALIGSGLWSGAPTAMVAHSEPLICGSLAGPAGVFGPANHQHRSRLCQALRLARRYRPTMISSFHSSANTKQAQQHPRARFAMVRATFAF